MRWLLIVPALFVPSMAFAQPAQPSQELPPIVEAATAAIGEAGTREMAWRARAIAAERQVRDLTEKLEKTQAKPPRQPVPPAHSEESPLIAPFAP